MSYAYPFVPIGCHTRNIVKKFTKNWVFPKPAILIAEEKIMQNLLGKVSVSAIYNTHCESGKKVKNVNNLRVFHNPQSALRKEECRS